MRVVRPNSAAAKQARLSYRTLQTLDRDSLLEIDLQTGRKHQIRVQLSSHGFPIVGDRKYGSRVPFAGHATGANRLADGIALHARRLTISHPVGGEELDLVAPLPQAWNDWGVSGNE
jgi:23S rRNA pseudouridine1911/1915/1917 synthase